MPQAIGFAIAGLIGATVSAAAATTIGTIAIGIATSLASTALSMVLAPQQPSIKPSDAQQEVKLPLAPRTKSYGRVKKAGAIFWMGTDPNSQRQLYVGSALNHGRIDAIEKFFIDENEVTLNGSGKVTTSPYDTRDTFFRYRLGLPTETPYSQLSVFGMSAVRGDGVASIVGQFENWLDANKQLENYPSSIPEMRVVMRASVCFDPREPLHDVNDQSTWTWSENAFVIILNYMIDPDGFGMNYASRILPNLAEWIAAMNICDEDVALVGGGTEKRYRSAGTYGFTERPRDVLVRMLSACDGRVWQRRDGTIGCKAGRFTVPTVSIESRDILSYSVVHGQDPLTKVVGLRAQFMSPVHDYKEHEAEPWPSGTAIVGLDDDRVDTLDLLWSPSQGQTRRIMKREYLRRTAEWRVTISTNLSGMRAMDEQFINLSIDELGISHSFEIQKFTFDPSTMTCQMELISVGAEIDDWDAAAEEGIPVPLSSLTLFTSVTPAFGAGVSWPVGIQAGDVAVLLLGTTNLDPGAAIPESGFELLSFATGAAAGVGSNTVTGYAAYRILDGTETGTLSTPSSLRAMLVFRGDRPIKAVAQSVWSAAAGSGDLSSQAISAASASSPVVALAWTFKDGSNTFSTQSPAFAQTIPGASSLHLTGYTIYTSSPVNHTVDINDGGNYNFLTSGWLSFTA